MQLDLQKDSQFQKVEDIEIPDIFYRKMKCGISEIDILFTDGFLPGGTFTLTAEPGCGKTTLMLQILNGLDENYAVGYATGEENIFQLAYTAKRLNCTKVPIANITDVDMLVEKMSELDFLVIDSFQSLTTKDKLNSREKEEYCVQEIVKAAKANECTVCFIVHQTKMGQMKGTTLVPHTVDANLHITVMEGYENDGGRTIYFTKNRYGPCNTLNAFITLNGYDFSIKKETPIEEMSAKNKRKNKLYDAILNMSGDITVSRLVEVMDVNVIKANTLLRELTQLGKIVKIGRGNDATWTIVKGEVSMDV